MFSTLASKILTRSMVWILCFFETFLQLRPEVKFFLDPILLQFLLKPMLFKVFVWQDIFIPSNQNIQNQNAIIVIKSNRFDMNLHMNHYSPGLSIIGNKHMKCNVCYVAIAAWMHCRPMLQLWHNRFAMISKYVMDLIIQLLVPLWILCRSMSTSIDYNRFPMFIMSATCAMKLQPFVCMVLEVYVY